MENFVYYTPTKLVFGRDTEQQVGALCREAGAKKVLLHYGGGSVIRSGLIDRVKASLDAAGIAYVELGGAVPNPRLSLVREGIELCRKEGVDFLLPIGGGSAVDSAKAIGYGVPYDGDVWELYEKKAEPVSALPLGCIVTLAATGTEMSNSSVITNEDGWKKRGLGHDLGRPHFAILNPELTYTLPAYQTFCGCTDIMMHTMERYFTRTKHHALTDRFSEALLRTVMHNSTILLKNPEDYNARAEVMWAGSVSHNGLLNCGGDRGDWASHQLEHELGGMFDVAHGAGLAAVWGSWARYVYREDVQRFYEFAVNVMNCEPDIDDMDTVALAGIEAMERFFQLIGMPIRISEMGVELTEAQIDELAYKCSFERTRTVGTFKVLEEADLREIYRMAR
jgi:Uncharacterized oxidoreductases, Fe-dependent alcohol dehydrogenase family